MAMEDVLGQYELTEEDCQKKISDKNLDTICSKCSFPYGRLAPHLKVGPACAEDIKRDSNLRSELERRSSLLKEWKQSNGSGATYKALLGALLGIERREDAEEICKLLKDSTQLIPDASSGKLVHVEPVEGHSDGLSLITLRV